MTTNKIRRKTNVPKVVHIIYTVAVLVAILCAIPVTIIRTAVAQEQNEGIRGIFKKQAIATAGALSNMRNSENSIKFLSNELLGSAIVEARKYLDVDKQTTIVFTSVPTSFIDGKTDSDKVSCDKRLEETTESPIVYTDKSFYDSETLMDWISDFSQGRGKEGKNLYRRCSGSCSPQYKYNIQLGETAFLVTAEVICGKARNKSDDLYELVVKVVN